VFLRFNVAFALGGPLLYVRRSRLAGLITFVGRFRAKSRVY